MLEELLNSLNVNFKNYVKASLYGVLFLYNEVMETIQNLLPQLSKRLIETGFDLLIIIAIFIVAKIAINVFSKITGKTMKKADEIADAEKSKQLKTSMTVTHSANRYIVYLIAIILCLKVIGLGEQVSSAIVAAGIGGLVISLGAQSIVKDMIAGMFLLFEKQFFVGDYVKICGYEGTVKSIALRVTYLDCAGKRVIIPNGEIRDVINYSRTNSLAIIEIPTSYEQDTRKIVKVLQDVVDKYYETNADLLTDNKAIVPGISSLTDRSVNITIRVETKPLKHWQVQRELLLLIKEEFKKKKIDMPYNQIVINKK